jgi:hypothetical protein
LFSDQARLFVSVLDEQVLVHAIRTMLNLGCAGLHDALVYVIHLPVIAPPPDADQGAGHANVTVEVALPKSELAAGRAPAAGLCLMSEVDVVAV